MIKQILEKANKEKVKFIYLQFTDLAGSIKSATIPVGRLKEFLERGIWFDGSSVEGLFRVHESDALLKPDPKTFRILPWSKPELKAARIICDIYNTDHTPFEGSPRNILRKTAENLRKEQKMIYNVGSEIEFFVFQKDEKLEAVPHDEGGYFDFSPYDLATQAKEEILVNLEKLGIQGEMTHHECGKGQHEIDIRYNQALEFADDIITTKYTIRAIAQKYNLYVSFMPKPILGEPGSGMHVHQSLFSPDGKNLFHDSSNKKYKLSKLAYSFLAGQLKFAEEICGVLCPIVNSYKRLVPGYEAPTKICWGQINRSALIRIPSYSKGRESSARLELRNPDPSCNPYLAYAITLKAGLEGIKNKLTPLPAVEEDVYKFSDEKLEELNIKSLPNSLGEAVKSMEKSKLIKEVLGPAFQKFIKSRKKEWQEYIKQITPWERKKYLEAF